MQTHSDANELNKTINVSFIFSNLKKDRREIQKVKSNLKVKNEMTIIIPWHKTNKQGQKENQQSTKHNKENERLSNNYSRTPTVFTTVNLLNH